MSEADPPPFRIEFRSRKGWSDSARITHDKGKSVITIHNPYQSGRGQLMRVGDKWPDSLEFLMKRTKHHFMTALRLLLMGGLAGTTVNAETDPPGALAGMGAWQVPKCGKTYQIGRRFVCANF